MTRHSPRREAFVRAYASGATGADAARVAGYGEAGCRQRARELLCREDVQARLRELQAEQAKAHEITVAKTLDRIEEARAMALATKDASALNKNAELYAKIGGLLIDKVDQRVQQVDSRSDEEIERSIAAKMRALGLDAKLIEHVV